MVCTLYLSLDVGDVSSSGGFHIWPLADVHHQATLHSPRLARRTNNHLSIFPLFLLESAWPHNIYSYVQYVLRPDQIVMASWLTWISCSADKGVSAQLCNGRNENLHHWPHHSLRGHGDGDRLKQFLWTFRGGTCMYVSACYDSLITICHGVFTFKLPSSVSGFYSGALTIARARPR